jgi:hypothetical protein
MEKSIEVFEERRGRILAALRVKRPVYVALVSSDKAYGGPEEGGWYFDTQQVVEQIPVDSLASMVGTIHHLKALYSNDGNHRPDSVLCRGWLEIVVRTKPVMDEPRVRPRYC